MTAPHPSLLEQARELHRRMLTVDTHCDTPSMQRFRGWDLGERHRAGALLGGDVDLPRMEEGGLAAIFMAVYVPQGPRTPEGYASAKARAESMLDALDAALLKHHSRCERALSPADARRIFQSGKRTLFLGMENGYPLGLDLSLVDAFHQRGIRYLTLCHALDNDLCASCTFWSDSAMTSRATADTGLTEFGARVVRRMNQLGMMVDVSHTSAKTVEDVLGMTRIPVIASHSGARAVADHPRNLTDDQLRAIAAHGGVVQALFVPGFLHPGAFSAAADKASGDLWNRAYVHYGQHAIGEDLAVDAAFEAEHQALLATFPLPPASVRDVANHIDHVVKIAGIDHVGIGSDFDGGAYLTDCRDVTELPHLTAELLRRGYTEPDLRKIWGENLLRVFDEVIRAAGV